jgi:hypothetical protein
LLASVVLALIAASCPSLQAQTQVTGISTRAVGGISIDAAGMLTGSTIDEFDLLRKARLDMLGQVPDGLDDAKLDPATGMRKVSLRRLDEAMARCLKDNQPVSAEIACLGGLQQVRYVFVYPDQNDIVLAGPGEAWKVDDRGAIVGKTTGRPVLLLDDLLVALRAANGRVRSVISCSIDPTPEGLQRLKAHARRLRTIGNPQATAMGIEQQLGPQKVSVTGVPETSHYARVLVAADYRMKRMGMGIEPAPIRGLPAFTQWMRASGRGMGNMLPRWWLAPNYEPLLRDADGLAWEIRGASVKAMAETDFFNAAGVRQESRPADPATQKWAETLTQRYDELALADPVFGQLRNCMDLAVVAALVASERLTEKAQVQLPMLMGTGVEAAEFPAPKQVPSEAALAKKGRKWMIACGGVQINAWEIVARAESSEALNGVRENAALADQADRWWD